MVELEVLEKVSLLKGLDPGQMAEVQALAAIREYEEGAVLFSEGEKAEFLRFVISGQVDLRFDLPLRATSKATTVTTIKPGKSMGFSSLVKPHRYALTGYCTGGKCVIVEVGGEELRALMDEKPEIGYILMSNLARVISKRFRAMQEEVVRREGYDILMQW